MELAQGSGSSTEAEATIPGLVELLNISSSEEQEKAVAALWRLAEKEAGQKVAIAEAGALPALVQVLQSGTPGSKEQAAGALGSLADNRENQASIAQAGAIPPLVELLRSTGAEAQRNSAGALSNLAHNEDNRVSIAAAGAIPPLLELLQSPSPEVQEKAAGALWVLSWNGDNAVTTAAAGGIPPLLKLLESGTAKAKEAAAGALRQLAKSNGESQATIAAASLRLQKELVSILVDDGTVSGLIDKVKIVRRANHLAIKLCCNPYKVLPESDAQLLADLFKATDSSDVITAIFEHVTFEGSGWRLIAEALVTNSHITGWVFAGNRLPVEHAAIIAAHFASATHVCWFRAGGAKLTSEVLETIARAALARDKLSMLQLVTEHPVHVSETCLELFVRVRAKFPDLPPQGGPPCGSELNALIARASIRDVVAEELVQALQKTLLHAARAGGEEGCRDLKIQLSDVGAKAEKLLLGLFPALTEKYVMLGGVALFGLLPPDMDEYRGSLTQDVPTALESPRSQVTWQLANASYQGKFLQEVAHQVIKDLAPLSGVRTSETYFSKALVDAVLERHGLLDLSVDVPSYDFTFPEKRHGGVFKYFGHLNGHPTFLKETDGSEGSAKRFIYRHPKNDPASWALADGLGSHVSFYRVLRDNSLPTPTAAQWQGADGNWKEVKVKEAAPSKVFLRDVLLDFMVKKTHPDIKRHLELGDELVQVEFGPPKALARALEKGPTWLNDLNRCTFKVDTVPMMVTTFLLLQKGIEAPQCWLCLGIMLKDMASSKTCTVEQCGKEAEFGCKGGCNYCLCREHAKERGGRITRFNNYHLSKEPEARDFQKTGGILEQTPDRPPCLHINFVTGPPGRQWTFEVMIMIADFAHVKTQLHKFYDLTRAKGKLAPLLPPVFPPWKPQAATPSGSMSKDDASGLATKVDLVLDAVLKAERATTNQLEESKAALKSMQVQLEAQTQTAKSMEQQLLASQDAVKKMELLLQAQAESMRKMELKLEASKIAPVETQQAETQQVEAQANSVKALRMQVEAFRAQERDGPQGILPGS